MISRLVFLAKKQYEITGKILLIFLISFCPAGHFNKIYSSELKNNNYG
jgi:hypothetical protein